MRRLLTALLCVGLSWTATSLAGESQLTPVSAAELRSELERATAGGEAVVLVNFWATWCRPCLDEIPLFMQLEQEYGDRGFRLMAVSLDDIDSMNDQVVPFMNKWFPSFRSYISSEYDMDDAVSVIDSGWNEVLPTSYLLARDGNVAERLQGIYTHQQFAEKIDALLASP